jgi:hypothetical protein
MKIAREKVWQTKEGKLVPDGDPDSAFLVAAKGQEVPDRDVAAFEDADKFFGPASNPVTTEETVTVESHTVHKQHRKHNK